MKQLSAILSLVSTALVSSVGVFAAENAQTITVQNELKIPEATLAPGQYTFSEEDHLSDRSIVRIVNSATGAHYLVLAVPDAKVKGAASGRLILFHAADGATERSVQAWACHDCSAPLAFVYPKAEAAKITGDSGDSAMAVDPSYDKLPANLSQDDMKVVTLWLLTPKEVTPDHKGEGVTGAKLADVRTGTTEIASASAPRHRLPKTASDTYEWALAGILLMFAGSLLRWTKVRGGVSR